MIAAIVGVQVPNLTGGVSKMLPNHHITKPVLIGEIKDDGQFDDRVEDRRASCPAMPGRSTSTARRI